MLSAGRGCRQGPSEFYITGVIKSWTIVDDIHKVTIPVLLINGAYDEATDLCMRPYFEKLQKVKWVTLPNSSHMSIWEERDKYMEVVNGFLEEN